MMTKAIRLATLTVLACTWAGAVAAYSTLPATIPIHFDFAGRPDAVGGKAWWFLLPTVATALVVPLTWLLPIWVDRLAASNSRWLNVPDRERFRALPPPARQRALSPLRHMLPILGLEVLLLFAWLLYASHRVAVGRADRLHHWPALACVAAVVATALGFAAAGLRAVQREVQRA
jgi:hypothetical protein